LSFLCFNFMIKKASFMIVNVLFDILLLSIGMWIAILPSIYAKKVIIFESLQIFGFTLVGLSIFVFYIHWWFGAGRKLDEIFRDYLFKNPFLVGDNMPLSEFSSSTIIRLSNVRSFIYAALLVPTSKKNKFMDAWADKYEYKSKLTFLDRLWAIGFFVVLALGMIIFGISLL